MKRTSWAAGVLVGLGAAFGVQAAGCFSSPPECELGMCEGAATGGGGGGAPAGCVPSEYPLDPVDDACGVFVSSTMGDETASGTKAAPMRTLNGAIARALEKGTPRVYACAEDFTEAVEVPGGVTIFGGVQCLSNWEWIGAFTPTELTAAEGEIPLAMRGGEGIVRIEDLDVTAPSIDPTNVALQGASSIAAVAEGLEVEIVRSDLRAGDAAPGAEGEAFMMGATSGADGNAGNDACTANQVNGGDEQVNDCGTPGDTMDDSVGGLGGSGTQFTGGAGSPGVPVSAMNGGAGDTGAGCTVGTAGDPGAAGTLGEGAAGMGTVDASGYVGVPGGDAGKGGPGQGGGAEAAHPREAPSPTSASRAPPAAQVVAPAHRAAAEALAARAAGLGDRASR